jgi:hypothetical protein
VRRAFLQALFQLKRLGAVGVRTALVDLDEEGIDFYSAVGAEGGVV